jgi:hypothetical protein
VELTDIQAQGLAKWLARSAYWNLPSQLRPLAKVLKERVGGSYCGFAGSYDLMVLANPQGCDITCLITNQRQHLTWNEAASLVLRTLGSTQQRTLF